MLMLSETQLEQMRAHVRVAAPEEACGILAGQSGRVTRVIPVTNSLRSPLRYRMDAREQIDALFWLEDQGQDLLGIYHSHPAGPQIPSPTDINEFAYPPALTVIWYPDGDQWRARAFAITDGTAREVEIYVDA